MSDGTDGSGLNLTFGDNTDELVNQLVSQYSGQIFVPPSVASLDWGNIDWNKDQTSGYNFAAPDFSKSVDGGGAEPDAPQGLLSQVAGGASKFIKENPGLSQSLLAGLAGVANGQNQKDIAGMQIDYLKEKQRDLNNSVKSYGKTIAAPRN